MVTRPCIQIIKTANLQSHLQTEINLFNIFFTVHSALSFNLADFRKSLMLREVEFSVTLELKEVRFVTCSLSVPFLNSFFAFSMSPSSPLTFALSVTIALWLAPFPITLIPHPLTLRLHYVFI